MKYIIHLFYFCAICLTAQAQKSLDSLSINQIQVIASHNSYRLRTHKPIYNWTRFFHLLIPKEYDTRAWDYSHLPLEQQFDNYHVRGIELDVYYDPQGGRYANRKANLLVLQSAKSRIPALEKPGFKIIHIADIDYNTNYYTFVEALTALKKWSDAHPKHVPIFVQVEIKNAALGDHLKLKALPKAIPFSPIAADSLDAEIRAVFGNDLQQVFTPDKVRGSFSTLNEAVIKGNLPTLAAARGKIFFVVDGCESIYAAGHPSLKGRVMFTYAVPHSPECAFIIVNDAIRDRDSITKWVREGYMIRTRCDADTYEARIGEYSRQKAAFESGAQILSTDYYRPDERYKTSKKWTNYVTRFEEGAEVRRNVVSRR